ncbi:hypothetical protein GCM10012284_24010 [Mangrovihabitans endophyticus]|uniref:Phage head-tail joining protein n=1 Tax=Mangrovihabitans endophyticus TaxID=1751298 RepID=A0A8J3BXR7_9ACTN|nr:hypothetical protein GCM10012284_24010 [Mangrovihabitans endophyticus]
MRIGAHELRRQLAVWREAKVDDGQGGNTVTLTQVGTVWAKAGQPTAAERLEAMRAGVDLAYVLHMLPDADVRRGDELRGDGEVLRVKATVRPSDPVYLRADCEAEQYQTSDEES